ncbi:MAG: hypothetical protein Q9M45_03170 [Robiginitomaculum sp.]|nr:hypothetical protein [Robiginitomaculum sp.]
MALQLPARCQPQQNPPQMVVQVMFQPLAMSAPKNKICGSGGLNDMDGPTILLIKDTATQITLNIEIRYTDIFGKNLSVQYFLMALSGPGHSISNWILFHPQPGGMGSVIANNDSE